MAGSSAGTLRAALRHRDLRRLLLAAAVSQTGDWLYHVSLSVYVYERTGSAAWVSFITVGRLAPYVLLAPVGGVVADRYERRRVLVGADLVRLAVMSLITVAVAADGPVVLLALLATLSTCASAVTFPATVAMLPDLVGEDDLAAANGAMSAIENASVIVGPALGAALLAATSPTVAFAINAVTFAFSAALIASMRTRSEPRPAAPGESAEQSHGLRRELTEGARALVGEPTARALAVLVIGTSFLYGALTIVLVIVASEEFARGTDQLGLLYGAMGLGGILAAPVAARLSRSARLGSLAYVGLVVGAVPIALLAVTEQPAVAMALVCVSGLGQVGSDVLSITELQRTSSDEVKGRVFGILDSLVVLAILAGSLLVPPLESALGADGAFVVLGVAAPVLALSVGRRLLEADRESGIVLAHLRPVVEVLAGIRMFEGLSRGALERLAAGAETVRVPAGEAVVREGDAAEHFYVLRYGTVEVVSTRTGERPVATLGEGEYFGEIGLLKDAPRTATVRAVDDCVCFRFGAEAFRAAVSSPSTVAALALEGTATRLAMLDG